MGRQECCPLLSNSPRATETLSSPAHRTRARSWRKVQQRRRQGREERASYGARQELPGALPSPPPPPPPGENRWSIFPLSLPSLSAAAPEGGRREQSCAALAARLPANRRPAGSEAAAAASACSGPSAGCSARKMAAAADAPRPASACPPAPAPAPSPARWQPGCG